MIKVITQVNNCYDVMEIWLKPDGSTLDYVIAFQSGLKLSFIIDAKEVKLLAREKIIPTTEWNFEVKWKDNGMWPSL